MSAKFLVLPVAAYSDQFDFESDAFGKAKSLASQFESDFVVIEARFLGVYQRVSPVFSYDDPTEPQPSGRSPSKTSPASDDSKAPSPSDDELPF